VTALAHGFASPRRRGFAIVGNQYCTDSAETIAHYAYAGKSDDANDADFADVQALIDIPAKELMQRNRALPGDARTDRWQCVKPLSYVHSRKARPT
jgi:hypothetical protein